MNRRLFLSSGIALAAACGDGAAQTAVETIALDMAGPRPTAQLRIGDSAPATAIFDSGAAASVVTLAYAQRLGLPNLGTAAAHGPNGTPVQGFRTRLDNATLGGAPFSGALAVALNMNLPLEGIDAVISPSVFSGRLVRYDFPAGVAEIAPRAQAPSGRPTAYVGESRHGQLRRTPGVEVLFPGGTSVIATADSGSARSLLLPSEFASRLPLMSPPTPVAPVRMVGAEFPATRTQISGEVRVGPLRVANPEITFAEGAAGGIVGMQILRNAILVLDPQRLQTWLLAPA
jgi:hypothetical protein